MNKHLAIFTPTAVKQIFEGKKKVETRFSQKRIAPFGVVSVGDIVYIKPSGEEIKGQFLVKKVISIEGLDEADWRLLVTQYGKEVSFGSEALDRRFLDSKKSAMYGTIIFIERVEQFITPPVRIEKRDSRGWVVLD